MSKRDKLPAAKPSMSPSVRAKGDKAIARHMDRDPPPRMELRGDLEGEGIMFDCPFDGAEDAVRWEAMIYQAFGTRSMSVATYFCESLARLCGRTADWEGDEFKGWVPNVAEFNAVLAIVNATKPRNEAEAALAVNLCALHLSAMNLAKRTTVHFADARTVAVLSKTVRAYGDGLEQLKRIQGKGRTVTQKIRAESHKHVHQHIHYHGEAPSNGAGVIESSATVPGQSAKVGQVVPLPSREGPPRLSNARRGGGNGRA